jgi:hypothetical protein
MEEFNESSKNIYLGFLTPAIFGLQLFFRDVYVYPALKFCPIDS